MAIIGIITTMLVGALADRPDPSRELMLYLDEDTKIPYVCDGEAWHPIGGGGGGGLPPGVTGDGLTPGGLNVAGRVRSRFSGAFGWMSAQIPISAGSSLGLEMDSIDWDTDGYFHRPTAGHGDWFIAPWDGFYRFEAAAFCTETGGASFALQLTQTSGGGGTNWQISTSTTGIDPWGNSIEAGQTFRLLAGSILIVQIYNNGSGTIHVGGQMSIEYRGTF